ncbi:GerMN domain-containing protein [Anaerosalibacter bizertensis]|uniref:GerMN domain-containing protein n=1 Tax=Anaerosalibacter bizertensis TaxID=932217 RepID=A0A844FJH6_9FIRM|nr:GerMN domain-containing protein [Anaerosalibacter bizertensis]MBU5292898.1 GerMN domain-containing protein [Anaerosalibacter bizertensis]MSS44257.1 GerMN domain-containing protein [Anaerosalibacter bizertensis]
MKFKKFLLIVLILSISINVGGCKGKDAFKKLFSKKDDNVEIIRSDEEKLDITEEDGLRNTVMYFKNSEGFLVPVMRKLPWEEGIAKIALKNMIDTPTLREDLNSTGLEPIIPAGTEIRGMTIDEDTGVCKVDFNNEFLNYESEKDESNLIKSVVYTLTEFPTIREVQILVEGEAVSTMKYGTQVEDSLRREDINLVKNLEGARSKVLVYFKGEDNEEYEYFVPVTVPTLAPMPNVFTALEELFQGPPENTGLSSNVYEVAELQGVEVKDGIAYVDLSFDSLKEENKKDVLEEVYKSVGLTLSQFDEIGKVELLIDGKTLEEAGMDFEYDESIPTFANEY